MLKNLANDNDTLLSSAAEAVIKAAEEIGDEATGRSRYQAHRCASESRYGC
jgi:hypothetical protein